MGDNLKLAPGSSTQEVLDKIKFDASQPANFFVVPKSSNGKKVSSKKPVTKSRKITNPK